jgi:hypothetical protein
MRDNLRKELIQTTAIALWGLAIQLPVHYDTYSKDYEMDTRTKVGVASGIGLASLALLRNMTRKSGRGLFESIRNYKK